MSEIAMVTQMRDATNTDNNNTKSNTSQTNTKMEVEVKSDNNTQKTTNIEGPTTNLETTTTTNYNDELAPETWGKIEFRKRHSIYADALTCPEETQVDKRHQLEEQIHDIAHLLGISTRRIGETNLIKIDLTSAEDKMIVCQYLEDHKIDYCMSLKGKETDTENYENPKRSTELVVKDIPLGVTKDEMGKKFSY